MAIQPRFHPLAVIQPRLHPLVVILLLHPDRDRAIPLQEVGVTLLQGRGTLSNHQLKFQVGWRDREGGRKE